MRLDVRVSRRAKVLARVCVVMCGAVLGAAFSFLASRSGVAHTPLEPHGTSTASLAAPIVGGTATRSGNGWWEVGSDGGVFGYGDALYKGSMGGTALNRPVVGMAPTRSGNGYWLVASDGGIFSFGDAAFHGSTGNIALNRPIVGMAVTRSGNGYWLVASDGGVFAFGDAAFYGSTGSIRLVSPIVGMVPATNGLGYWLVAADGGLFAFGQAPFAGSAAGAVGAPAVAMAATPSGHGYWIATRDGEVFGYGDAANYGSGVGLVGAPYVALVRQSSGLRLVASDGTSVGLSSGGPAVSQAATPVTPALGSSSSYTWMVTNDDGSPARFNPCAPIHYVVNATAGPANAISLVQGAMQKVAAATGMTFVYDGQTSEIPTSNRAPQQARYGSGWAPVVVAWARPSQTDLLPGGNTIGEGGSWWVMPGNDKVYVTGAVVIDPDNTSNLLAAFGAGASLGELLMHEIGHVVGLGHTQDRAQIMFPQLLPLPSASYGAGDLAGLHQLGRAAGCLSEPQP